MSAFFYHRIPLETNLTRGENALLLNIKWEPNFLGITVFSLKELYLKREGTGIEVNERKIFCDISGWDEIHNNQPTTHTLMHVILYSSI